MKEDGRREHERQSNCAYCGATVIALAYGAQLDHGSQQAVSKDRATLRQARASMNLKGTMSGMQDHVACKSL